MCLTESVYLYITHDTCVVLRSEKLNSTPLFRASQHNDVTANDGGSTHTSKVDWKRFQHT